MTEVTYKWWVTLNEEGRRLYGKIFPESIVPVLAGDLQPHQAHLDKIENPEAVYRIDWNLLTGLQKSECVMAVAKQMHVDPEAVRQDFEARGFIPLRAKYVVGAGTTEIHLFI